MQKGAVEGKKYCKRCGQLKPIEYFERNRPGVFRSECKDCRKLKKRIPARAKRDYERNHPRPAVDTWFYCRICKRHIMIEQSRDVCLDHDHATGKIRGWICNRCNTGMGNFQDDVNILQRAILWLKGNLASILSSWSL